MGDGCSLVLRCDTHGANSVEELKRDRGPAQSASPLLILTAHINGGLPGGRTIARCRGARGTPQNTARQPANSVSAERAEVESISGAALVPPVIVGVPQGAPLEQKVAVNLLPTKSISVPLMAQGLLLV